ncbi:MAG: hypothetical protein AAGD96_32775, partial [Chloroflexota bacterium]
TTYQATALISVSSPSLDVIFDDRIVTETDGPTTAQNNDLPNLALSDAVIFDLFEQVKDQLPSTIKTFNQLRSQLDASTENRSEIVVLMGTFEDPELSALVVNEWSNIFVKEANQFFEGEIEASQAFLQQQLGTAEADQDRINAEWAAFQARNDLGRRLAELEAQRGLQQSYINRLTNLELLEYDIQGIKTQIVENPDRENVLTDFTLNVLQNRAFGTAGNIQFEITSFDALSSSLLQDRVGQLNDLEVAIESQKSELIDRIEDIGPSILDLQEEVTLIRIEESNLSSEREIILNTSETLARKVAEGEIEQNDTTGKAQVAARAIAPAEPESRNRITSSAVVTIAVAIIAIIIILVLAWWNEESGAEASEPYTVQNN